MLTAVLSMNSVLDLAVMEASLTAAAGLAVSAEICLMRTPAVEISVVRLGPGVFREPLGGAVFVVLSGTASLVFEDTDSLMFLRPGVVGRMDPGSRIRWSVNETLTFVRVVDAVGA